MKIKVGARNQFVDARGVGVSAACHQEPGRTARRRSRPPPDRWSARCPGSSWDGGDEQLGQIRVRGFFHTLSEVHPLPDAIMFLNSGVKLVANGSPVLDDLRALSEQGIALQACGTCLGHYELKDRVAVGEISNMYAIAEALLNAGKVVSL